MNTADRSLALVDCAPRRRFALAWVLPAFGDSFRAFLLGAERGAPAEIADRIAVRDRAAARGVLRGKTTTR